jgi:serine/threonine protein kinase
MYTLVDKKNKIYYVNGKIIKHIPINKYGIDGLIESCIMRQIKHPYINHAEYSYCDRKGLYIIQKPAIDNYYKWRLRNIPDRKLMMMYINQLISAVKILHDLNIIHGDIKSQNILMYEDGIRLSDFSHSTKYTWNREYICCTSTHRPIEVWLGSVWNEKVDIWALGCTIFEMVYGYSLFADQSMMYSDKLKDRYINAIRYWSGKHTDINFIKPLLPDCFDPSDPINKLILSCLKYNPYDRYIDTEICDNLEPIFTRYGYTDIVDDSIIEYVNRLSSRGIDYNSALWLSYKMINRKCLSEYTIDIDDEVKICNRLNCVLW